MKIIVADECIKKEIQSYINYLNTFTIKLNLKGRSKVSISKKTYPVYTVRRGTLYVTHKPLFVDISTKKIFKLRKFNFKYDIIVDSSIRSCMFVLEDQREFKRFSNYVSYLKMFHVECKLSSKSSVVVDGETFTNIKTYIRPLRHENDEGYAYLCYGELSSSY